jgi:carboxymethylenebutenolidase
MTSSNIQLNVNNRPVNAYLALPASGTGPGILVLHAWWGLKPFFKQLCDRLAKQGFVAFAPDLNRGEIATTISEAEALRKKEDSPFTEATVMAAKDYLLKTPALEGNTIAVMGFSMGAAWSLWVAAAAPEQVSAVTLFYGIYGVNFGEMNAKILGHFAEVDEWEPLDGVRAVEKEMKAAGLDVTFHVYPGVSHWFMEDDRPEYDPAVAAQAWERTIDFLKKELA